MKDQIKLALFWCWAAHCACLVGLYVESFFVPIRQELLEFAPSLQSVGWIQFFAGIIVFIARLDFGLVVFPEEQRRLLCKSVFPKAIVIGCLLLIVTAIDGARLGSKGVVPTNGLTKLSAIEVQHAFRSSIAFYFCLTVLFMGDFIAAPQMSSRTAGPTRGLQAASSSDRAKV